MESIFYLLVFPGFLFLSAYGLVLEFVDRKLYARFQNRMGPPWFQPLADFIKLVTKESIVPKEADKRMFKLLPAFALAAACTAFLYVPIWSPTAIFHFNGDIIVVLYLLTVPTLTFFLGGWSSTSLYAAIGSVRTLTQLFAYEVPLFMAFLGPALLSGSWSISDITAWYGAHPLYAVFNVIGLGVAVIASQGKLERVPFDAPEAETEVVHGSFAEYSGRLLAIFRMTVDIELIVVASLVSAVFFPFFTGNGWADFGLFLAKTLFVVFILAAMRALFARLRIEQMVNFCWKVLTPLALLQIVIDLLVKGFVKL